MELLLSKVPEVRGIYNNKIPAWARYLHPQACQSLLQVEAVRPLVYTGIWRSSNASLWASKNKQGVLLPGFSAHGYGLAIDIAIDLSVDNQKTGYSDLLELMRTYGWYCHRQDHQRGFEDWHFNYLGKTEAAHWLSFTDQPRSATWHLAIEEKIKSLYQSSWNLSIKQCQDALKKLKFYEGKLDGIWGGLSVAALQAFQRAYTLAQNAYPTAIDMRVLAFATATKKVVA